MRLLSTTLANRQPATTALGIALVSVFALQHQSFATELASAAMAQESMIAPKTVADGSAVGDIEAASEAIEVGKNASAGNLVTSSGAVRIGAGSSVASITTQIGTISLGDGAMVVKDIVLESGTVTIGNGAFVMGKINVLRPQKGTKPTLKIVIEAGAAVQGGIMMGYPVQICVSKNASAGRISGGKALKCKS